MKELFVNFFTFGLAVTLERLLSFLLIPIYARVFSVTEFGIVDLIQTIISLVTIFAFLQLETALQRYYYIYKDNESRGVFVFTLIITMFLFSVVLSFLVCVLSPWIASSFLKDISYSTALRIAGLQMPFSILSTLVLIILRFERQFRLFTIMVLVKSIMLVAFVFFFLLHLNAGVNGFFLSQFIAITIAAILSCFFVRGKIRMKYSVENIKQSFSYALPQLPARIGSSLNVYANRFFMVGYLSTYNIGVFSMALKFGSIVQLFHQTFMMAWNQYMFKILENPNHKYIYRSVLMMIVPLAFFLPVFLSLIAPEIIRFFASIEYIEASKYIGMISLSFCILISSEIINVGPKVKEKTYYMSISFLISLFINLISLFVFIQLFELRGVLYAMVLTNLVLLVINWIFSERLYWVGYNIKHYCMTILPSLAVSIMMMYVELPLYVRCCLILISAIYYSLILLYSYRIYKTYIL